MSQRTMQAVFLDEPGKMSIREIPIPTPGPGEVLVRIASVGVCGSDVHFYEKGKIGKFVVREPLILGHESGGVVAEVGAGVTNVRPGDQVAIEPGVPCRCCHYCKTGHYNLCGDMQFMAAPPVHGAFCEYYVSPADFVFPLPEPLTTEHGSLCEPVSVAWQASRQANLKAGERVAVLGSGPIGLCHVAMANALGAGEIVAVDLIASRLELAKQMGATEVIDATQESPESYLTPDRIGDWADVVFECSGSEATVRQSIDVARPGGRVVWVGMGTDEATIPISRGLEKELSWHGVFRYVNSYPVVISLMARGKIDGAPLITHRFDFPAVHEAIEFSRTHRKESIKTMVNFPA